MAIMSVERIMSKPVVTIEPDDSLWVVKEIFDNTRFHHLLVIENGKLFGVVSDRDLLKAISPKIGTRAETRYDKATLNKRVHQVMTRKPITVHKNADIIEAVKLFNSHTISCLPVVDAAMKPIGIVTWRDILKELEAIRNRRLAKS